LKTFGLANHMYANERNDWFVPVDDDTIYPAGWYGNPYFIKVLAMITANSYGENVQKEYVCPSASARTAALNPPYNKYTFAPNITGMVRKPGKLKPGGAGTGYLGIKRSVYRQLADKLQFTDSTGNYCLSVDGADYVNYWDIYGDTNGDYNLTGWYTVAYRHNEGANILFCDGHVDTYKKERMFNLNRGKSNDPLWSFKK
jgi:prepilin-type processing-associated H-X9-DG protein